MKAGLLNQRISFFQPSMISDGQGGNNLTWSFFETCYAHVKALKAIEKVNNNGQVMEFDLLVRIRKNNNITEKMRVYHKSVFYEIISLQDVSIEETEILIKKAR